MPPLLSRLRSQKVLVVVAHPDDEVLGCGGLMAHLDLVAVVHVTDGAPRAGHDAHRLGFADPPSYAAARRGEAEAALALVGIGPDRVVGLGLADQGAAADLEGLARQLVPLVAKVEAVLTHSFEGGHPDHDAVAFGVHAATGLAARAGRRPALVEMPFYHAGTDGWTRQRFLPRPGAGPEAVLDLSAEGQAQKAAMVAAHRTQRDVLAGFDLSAERFRVAPDYDFEDLPQALLYERHAWNMTRATWISAVRSARAALGAGAL